jgi:hypothetical protein
MKSVKNVKKKGFLKRVKDTVRKTLDELKEDSVANNPQKPIDCCNPPVPRRTEHKTDVDSN